MVMRLGALNPEKHKRMYLTV